MKSLKFFALLIMTFLVVSCSSDEEDNSATTPTTIQASATVNWSAFTSATTNITSLVTIGGQPSSTYTVSTIKGDKVNFTFNIGSKNSSKVTREIIMLGIYFDNPTSRDEQFLNSLTWIEDPNKTDFDGVLGFEIVSSAPDDYDGKFNIYCSILEDGILLPDEYIIDPKIKIRASR